MSAQLKITHEGEDVGKILWCRKKRHVHSQNVEYIFKNIVRRYNE